MSGKVRSWTSSVMTIMLAFFICHGSCHLAAALHCEHDPQTAHAAGSEHRNHCPGEDHDVHSASEHEPLLSRQKQAVSFLLFSWIALDELRFASPATPAFPFPTDDELISTAPPPDPRQPRAPPLS